MIQSVLSRSLVLVLFALALSACSQVAIPTAAPTGAVKVLPSETATSTPRSTATPLPTLTLTNTPTVTAVPTQTPTVGARPSSTRAPIPTAGTVRIKLFFVALNDNGKAGKKIGCNDSIVAVDRTIPATSAVLTASIRELLSVKDQHYGQSGLYNALYQSNLRVTEISITNGKATIKLSGTYALGGVCDSPRFAAQLQETALQFSTVEQVAFFINGVPLEKLLSEK